LNVNTLVSTTLAGARPLGMRGEPLHAAQDQIRGALRRRLGERYSRLLADAQAYDGGRSIKWYTNAPGPVIRLADLPESRRQALLHEIDGLMGDVEALSRRYGQSSNEDGRLLGQALALAAQRPSDDYLFLVGDQPVIVCWGYEAGSDGTPPPAILAVPPAGGPADGATPADAGTPAQAAAATARRRSVRRWGAAGAVGVFLVFGGAWAMNVLPSISSVFSGDTNVPPPAPAAIAVIERHIRLSASVAELRTREAELRVELASLREQARREMERCRAAPPPADPSPAEPPGAQDAREPPAQALASAGPSACPAPRRAGAPPPELAIVLDGSPSMGMPSGLNAQVDDSLFLRSRRGDRTALGEIRTLAQTPGPKRLDDAKQAAARVIPALPGDVRVGYVVFDDCRAVQHFGFFGAADRPRLLSLIESKTARGGSPLARAIETAGNSMRSSDGVIVVFSDGRDTCGGNVCAVAQRLHAARPGIKAHVIDVTGGMSESTCLATITGGRIYSATNAQAAVEAFTDATAAFRVPAHCRPRQ
jgi:hypothetical protein